MPLVLDLRFTHERVGRSSDLSLNGNLRYPNDKDRSLNETVSDKILKYHTDYKNNPPVPVTFMTFCTTSVRRSLVSFVRKSAAPYPRLQLYVLS